MLPVEGRFLHEITSAQPLVDALQRERAREAEITRLDRNDTHDRRASPHGCALKFDAVRHRQASAHVPLWQRAHRPRTRRGVSSQDATATATATGVSSSTGRASCAFASRRVPQSHTARTPSVSCCCTYRKDTLSRAFRLTWAWHR